MRNGDSNTRDEGKRFTDYATATTAGFSLSLLLPFLSPPKVPFPPSVRAWVFFSKASIPLAQGILLVGSDAPDAADSAEVLQYYQTADLSGAAQQIKDKLVGSVRGGADSSPAAAVDGAALWRRAVQVIPDAGHSVASEQPAAFDTIVRSFVQDTFAVPSPNLHGETFGTCSGIAAKLPERQRGVMRKEEPGKTHIRARYVQT